MTTSDSTLANYSITIFTTKNFDLLDLNSVKFSFSEKKFVNKECCSFFYNPSPLRGLKNRTTKRLSPDKLDAGKLNFWSTLKADKIQIVFEEAKSSSYFDCESEEEVDLITRDITIDFSGRMYLIFDAKNGEPTVEVINIKDKRKLDSDEFESKHSSERKRRKTSSTKGF